MTEQQQKRWRLTWGDVSFTAADLTAEDVAAVDAMTGAGWSSDNPMSGPHVASNLIAVVVARLRGVPVSRVAGEVKASSADALVDALTVENVPA